MKTTALEVVSNAKVNLALDILGVQKTGELKGYHKIQTVITEITKENTAGFTPDLIRLKVSPGKKSQIKILAFAKEVTQETHQEMHQEAPRISSKEGPVYRAAELMLKLASKKSKGELLVEIEIEVVKNIPISSGLGGGASNAAAVINGLNSLLDLNLSTSKRKALAAKVSMDTPFFIEGGLALGENFGEKITKLPPVKGLAFTIFSGTGAENKTKKEFAKLTPAILKECGKNAEKTAKLIRSIRTNDSLSIHELLHNDFELLLDKPLPENIHLTGAGPSRFIVA